MKQRIIHSYTVSNQQDLQSLQTVLDESCSERCVSEEVGNAANYSCINLRIRPDISNLGVQASKFRTLRAWGNVMKLNCPPPPPIF
jgi:hypothetical protein